MADILDLGQHDHLSSGDNGTDNTNIIHENFATLAITYKTSGQEKRSLANRQYKKCIVISVSKEQYDMDLKTIKKFEEDNNLILPKGYVGMIRSSNNSPENFCEDYGDITIFSLEELLEAREALEMKKYCSEYIAVGCGGGGEIFVMEQNRESNTLIITEAGNLLSEYITPEDCVYLYDFFENWVKKGCPLSDIQSANQ